MNYLLPEIRLNLRLGERLLLAQLLHFIMVEFDRVARGPVLHETPHASVAGHARQTHSFRLFIIMH